MKEPQHINKLATIHKYLKNTRRSLGLKMALLMMLMLLVTLGLFTGVLGKVFWVWGFFYLLTTAGAIFLGKKIHTTGQRLKTCQSNITALESQAQNPNDFATTYNTTTFIEQYERERLKSKGTLLIPKILLGIVMMIIGAALLFKGASTVFASTTTMGEGLNALFIGVIWCIFSVRITKLGLSAYLEQRQVTRSINQVADTLREQKEATDGAMSVAQSHSTTGAMSIAQAHDGALSNTPGHTVHDAHEVVLNFERTHHVHQDKTQNEAQQKTQQQKEGQPK